MLLERTMLMVAARDLRCQLARASPRCRPCQEKAIEAKTTLLVSTSGVLSMVTD
jgi:hypothetical protein